MPPNASIEASICVIHSDEANKISCHLIQGKVKKRKKKELKISSRPFTELLHCQRNTGITRVSPAQRCQTIVHITLMLRALLTSQHRGNQRKPSLFNIFNDNFNFRALLAKVREFYVWNKNTTVRIR